MDKLCDDFNRIDDLKFLALVAHLYVEYMLNELICDSFRSPDLIIDDRDLGGFYNKLTLLKSIGAFSGKERLAKNIELLNRIRNYFVHNLMIEDKIPQSVEDQVNEMEYLEESNICDMDSDGVSFCDLSTLGKFNLIGMSTIEVLNSMLTDD